MSIASTLNAMIKNYKNGHRWDHLDSEALQTAIDEILSLEKDLVDTNIQLRDARSKLFPYADETEISGMSWSGFYLIGNDKSIKELHRINHRSAQLESYTTAFEERVKSLKQEIQRLQGLIK